ncbi:hypothetical protein NQ314_021273, partial [Rhamnusium bicolor]
MFRYTQFVFLYNCTIRTKSIHIQTKATRYDLCVVGKWCILDALKNETTDLQSVDLMIIQTIRRLRRCTIINFPNLKVIYGMNAGIATLEAWSFWNLTKLEKINLSYNNIVEIQYGVFTGLPISFLDLSWNEVAFIGQGAFHGMKNLKTLDLSRNYLTLFDGSFFAVKHITGSAEFPLEELLLSHNNLGTMVPFPSNIAMTKLDLTDNWLTDLVLPSGMYVEKLRISSNNFQDSDLLIIDNVSFVALDANPWVCEEYIQLLEYLLTKNITLLKYNEDTKIYFLTESGTRKLSHLLYNSKEKHNLSHNDIGAIIEEDTFHFNMAITKLDLTDNLLTGLALPSGMYVEELRISLNNIEYPDFLNIDNVSVVALDANPW